jgi:hypothetical protein
MMGEDDRIKAALYEAGLGGKRGRALFLKLLLTLGEKNPQIETMLMDTILPRMPEDDKVAIQFVALSWLSSFRSGLPPLS